MKKFNFKIRGKSYGVKIEDFEGTTAQVEVNGTIYEVEVEREEKVQKTPRLVRKPVVKKPGEGTINKSASSGYVVKAPLPGNIFKVEVAVGDEIKKGDNLLIMEAMKMENNVLSEKDGVVKAVKVAVGDAVLQGDVLIEIG